MLHVFQPPGEKVIGLNASGMIIGVDGDVFFGEVAVLAEILKPAQGVVEVGNSTILKK